MIKSILLSSVLGLALSTALVHAEEAKQPAKEKSAEKETAKPKPYPLTTCLVSGEELDPAKEAYVFDHKGQEIKLCCKKCLKKFNAEPEKYLKQLEDAAAKPKKEAEAKKP